MHSVHYLIIGIILYSDIGHSDGRKSTWRYTTACYGSDPACSGYQLECGIGERIVIGSLKYGGKSNPNRCQFGIADCQETLTVQNITKTVETWCCTYNPSDYLKDFNSENRTVVVTNCNGRQKCSGRVPRIFDFSYSSYVRIQYACINDNAIGMCSNSNNTGPDVFVTFNLSQGYSFPSLNGSRDCTCQVHSLDCSSRLELQIVALDLSQTGPSVNHACSNAYLDLTPTKKIACDLRNSLALPAVYSNVSWINTIALRHLFLNESLDRPNSVVIRVKAAQTRSPVSVECYQPGVEPSDNVRCPFTTRVTSRTSDWPTTRMPASRLSIRVTNSNIDKTTYLGFNDTSKFYPSESPDTTSSKFISTSSPLVKDTTHDNIDTEVTTRSTDLSSIGYVSTTKSQVSLTQYPTTMENNHDKTSSLSPTADISSSTSKSQSFKVPKPTSSLYESKAGESITTVAIHSADTKPTSEMSGQLRSEANEISTSATGDHTINSVEQSNTFTFSVIVPYEAANSSNKTGTTIEALVKDHTTVIDMTTRVGEDADNKGLIIGLTVGAVLIVVLVAAAVTLCCFMRLKKKETVERNYVRNTNIFYSFPDEYYVTENMSYEPADSDTDEIEDLRRSSRDHYGTVDRHSHTLKTHQNGTTLYMDHYKIKHQDSYPSEYQKDTENKTVVFVNGSQPEMTYYADSNDDNDDFQNSNCDKSVSFDPSSLYSKVKKEGKTKF